ncbi:hypothetical protein [Streptomyces avidinii]|uniref:Uncharacterized protein n=1 Tax=Streptomyces avidinii TaxID=1895 RepID=A0ABS4L730_STRAV|nr:hypothetical protein [Streptomyces avidinii]MBP2037897.1 hypothetical protein [Streptomyces avidinii]GGZ07878.1 hypothetical protein GCM10010343_37520 [Streptomyces avidinii]
MSGTENAIETETETGDDDGGRAETGALSGAESRTRNRKRLKAAAFVLAGLGFIVGGSLLAPDPEPSGWVAEPASSDPLYSGPGPTIEQVMADFEAATATAGLGPAAAPRSFMVPGCLAPWESYEHVSDARWAALLDNLTGRQWRPTQRLKRTHTVASSLTKGTWHLLVVHAKRPGTREHLSLVAANSTPACEKTFEQAEAAGSQAV